MFGRLFRAIIAYPLLCPDRIATGIPQIGKLMTRFSHALFAGAFFTVAAVVPATADDTISAAEPERIRDVMRGFGSAELTADG